MRIVDIRAGHEQDDIDAAKALVASEIDHPAKTVLFIQGNGAAVAQFADRAATRSDAFPWRECVWLKVSRPKAEAILGASRFAEWFPSTSVCAAMLDFADNVSERLESDATLFEIDAAFLNARG